jgi:hypothetical protein
MRLYLAILDCIPFGACNSWIKWGRMDLWNNWIDGGRGVARLASVQSPTLAQVVGVNLILHLFDIKISTLEKDCTVVTPICSKKWPPPRDMWIIFDALPMSELCSFSKQFLKRN